MAILFGKFDTSPVSFSPPIGLRRTIADLDGQADILSEHVSEAVNYRVLDRQFWS